MPPNNKVTRARDIMRHLYQSPTGNTYESIARALGYSASSVRQTCAIDYAKTFTRDITQSITLSDPIIWPEDTEFDLAEPIKEDEINVTVQTQKSDDMTVWMQGLIDYCVRHHGIGSSPNVTEKVKPEPAPKSHNKFEIEKPTIDGHRDSMDWIRANIPLLGALIQTATDKRKEDDKDSKDYWEIYNMLKSAIIMMHVQIAKDPIAKLKEYVK